MYYDAAGTLWLPGSANVFGTRVLTKVLNVGANTNK